MKLYNSQHSPNARRVRMFLAEKSVEVPTEEFDMMKAEQLSDRYKAINPRCTLPALELDDAPLLAECVAIMTYFEGLHPEPALLGSSPLERARIMMWEHRAEQDGFGSCEDAVRNGIPMLAGRAKPGPTSVEQIPALAERGKTRLLEFYAEVDGQLGKHEWLAGETFSAADITLLTVVDFAAAFGGMEVPEELTHLGRWHAQASARPSAKA